MTELRKNNVVGTSKKRSETEKNKAVIQVTGEFNKKILYFCEIFAVFFLYL